MSIGAGTSASATYLNAKPVVQQPDRQVIMQSVDIKRYHSESVADIFGKDMQARYGRHFFKGYLQQFLFSLLDVGRAHFVFQFDAKGAADGLQKTGSAAVFAGFDVVDVFVFTPRVGPIHGATAGLVGCMERIKRGVENQYSGTARSTQKFMRGKKYGVKFFHGVFRVHIDVAIGR